MIPAEAHARILQAMTQQHREELAAARALLIRYREFIEDAGLTPPDMSGAEALERFRNAFQVAGFADTMQHPELIVDWAPSLRVVEEAAA